MKEFLCEKENHSLFPVIFLACFSHINLRCCARSAQAQGFPSSFVCQESSNGATNKWKSSSFRVSISTEKIDVCMATISVAKAVCDCLFVNNSRNWSVASWHTENSTLDIRLKFEQVSEQSISLGVSFVCIRLLWGNGSGLLSLRTAPDAALISAPSRPDFPALRNYLKPIRTLRA